MLFVVCCLLFFLTSFQGGIDSVTSGAVTARSPERKTPNAEQQVTHKLTFDDFNIVPMRTIASNQISPKLPPIKTQMGDSSSEGRIHGRSTTGAGVVSPSACSATSSSSSSSSSLSSSSSAASSSSTSSSSSSLSSSFSSSASSVSSSSSLSLSSPHSHASKGLPKSDIPPHEISVGFYNHHEDTRFADSFNSLSALSLSPMPTTALSSHLVHEPQPQQENDASLSPKPSSPKSSKPPLFAASALK